MTYAPEAGSLTVERRVSANRSKGFVWAIIAHGGNSFAKLNLGEFQSQADAFKALPSFCEGL